MIPTDTNRALKNKLVFMAKILACCLILVLLLISCVGGETQPVPEIETEQVVSQPQVTEQPATSTSTLVVPTDTTQPTNTSTPTETPVPPTTTPTPTETPIPATPTVDIDATIRSANILLFEDMFFSRYIKQAMDEAGYVYTDIGDRIGTFKNEMLSDTQWDLIIAAAEGRGGVEGEFFDYIKLQLDKGASVIMEIWILDWVVGGRIQPILYECGIDFQANWVNPSDRGVYWIDPDHPLANEPNEVSLKRFVNYWIGDVGDLVELSPGSQAQIIGGTSGDSATRNGLITVCYDGRLILQTFSTHDHPQEEMVNLWQNYIYYAMKNRALSGE